MDAVNCGPGPCGGVIGGLLLSKSWCYERCGGAYGDAGRGAVAARAAMAGAAMAGADMAGADMLVALVTRPEAASG